jgi:uncharacterized protein with GYD domain
VDEIQRGAAAMSIFLMFGKYAPEKSEKICLKRTDEALAVIRKHGGNIRSMYTAPGEVDVVFAVEFPGVKDAEEASVELNKTTGISFTTTPVMNGDK